MGYHIRFPGRGYLRWWVLKTPAGWDGEINKWAEGKRGSSLSQLRRPS